MSDLDEQGRHEPPTIDDPVKTAIAFHRFLRETLIWKATGLTDEQARWSPVASGTCLSGLIKHSTGVERYWFGMYLGGQDVDLMWTETNPNADWEIGPNETIDVLMAAYVQQATESDLLLASLTAADWGRTPDTPLAMSRGRNIGWVLTHMVEEVGRHCGHADLIREMIDGSVGE